MVEMSNFQEGYFIIRASFRWSYTSFIFLTAVNLAFNL